MHAAIDCSHPVELKSISTKSIFCFDKAREVFISKSPEAFVRAALRGACTIGEDLYDCRGSTKKISRAH